MRHRKRLLFLLVLGFVPWLCGSRVCAQAPPPTAWAARYEGPGSAQDSARALAVDDVGNVYVTGSSVCPASPFDTDYTTVKYDAHGNQLWVARYDGSRNFADNAAAIAVDGAGGVYVTGMSAGAGVGFLAMDYATLKYAAVPNLRLAVTSVQRTGEGVRLTLRLSNPGEADATGLELVRATLVGVAAAHAPQSLGTIPVDGSATATLSFTGDFPAGTRALLRVQGSFEGGAFTASRRVPLP